MKTSFEDSRHVNLRLTRAIIKFHERGYTEDFFIKGFSENLYAQSAPEMVCNSFTIAVMDQCYDYLTRGFKYIHLIETSCGLKGILVYDKIKFVPGACC